MEAIIVPCTQEKIWDTQPRAGAVPAKDAYTKPAFRAWRVYAEQSGCPWFILSTKYGLLHPDQPIEPYDIRTSAAQNDPVLLSLLHRQGRELNLAQYEQIVLLDWERFEPLIRAAVPDRSVRCVLRRLQY
jgi:hypothetical protein